MADQNSLRIYPRGFLGDLILPQSVHTPRPFNNTLHEKLYVINDMSMRPSNEQAIPPNPHVESLYSAYIRNDDAVVTFEFKKKILQAALKAFGTSRFDLWYFTQQESPAASELHGRFMRDTLKFIREGKRDMALETWADLIVINDHGGTIKTKTIESDEFFGVSSNGVRRYPQNSKLTEVIQMWVSKPNGLEDLLGTLHILFGAA